MSEPTELLSPEELPEEEIRRLIERPPQEKLPEKPLRLKNTVITFIYAYQVYLKPKEVEKLLKVVGKGSLNYLLKSAAEFRELMRKEEFNIDAIEFPAVKYGVTEKVLTEAKKTLKGKKSKQAKKLVDELLKIGEGKPLIIARKEAKPFVKTLHISEEFSLESNYRDSLPYLRVEGPLEEIPFELILDVGKRTRVLEDSHVAVLRGLVSPTIRLKIKPMLRLHGGFPAFTLIVMVKFPRELELEVHQVNLLAKWLYPAIEPVGINLFSKRFGVFPVKLDEAFESALGFKPEFRYRGGAHVVSANLEFDKSFEELVKTYPLQVASLVSGRVDWWNESLRDAEKYIEEFYVKAFTEGVILGGIVLHRANMLWMPWLTPYNLSAILAYDLAMTAREIISGLIDSLRGGELEPRVLVGLREYVTRLLGELGGYYRIAPVDPFRSIWRNTLRFIELHRAGDELKELLSAIDRRLKRVEERKFSVISILLGALGVFGALEFILGVFSLWGINTYTKIVAGAVALTITTLLSAIIHYMRR